MKSLQTTIKCKYVCGRCSDDQVTVHVAARTVGQDLQAWMDRILIPAFMRNHAARSPRCTAQQFKHVMIPIDKSGNTPVGCVVPADPTKSIDVDAGEKS